jgi:Holliday junction resolvase RusA-like endonuclease
MPRPRATSIGGKARLYVPLRVRRAGGWVSTGVKEFREAVAIIVPPLIPVQLDGPIRVDVEYVFTRQAARIWTTKPMPRYRHVTRPDVDNLDKMLYDALTLAGVWSNDWLVCAGEHEKWHAAGGEEPHTLVTIRSVPLLENWSHERSKHEYRGQPSRT